MNRTIFITGASSGIGKATAKLFQEKGWNVVATMRTPEKEEELTGLPNVLVTRLDVLDPSSIEEALGLAIDKFEKIDVLVNNAGYGAYGPLEAFSSEQIRRQFGTNVLGLLDVTTAVLPHFRKNGNGTVINISSMGGKITFPLGSLYHGTKFAVEGISEALSFELEAIGCRMKIVEPGIINTDFGGRSLDFANDESLTEYQEFISKIVQALEKSQGNGSEAGLVAKVIYEAATDGSDRLRYIAGDDAEMLVENRKKMDDAQFLGGMKANFGL